MNERMRLLQINTCRFKGPNDNKSALVQVMAWYQINHKLLFEAVMSWFTDAYVSPVAP